MSARKRISRLVARDRKTLEETLSAGSKSGLKAPISSSKKPNKGDVKPVIVTATSHWILSYIEEVKASITSIFDRVLKLASTKKMVKKLAGHADKTAAWVTNVGNEYGQVLMSVLTEGEGDSLDLMLLGIIRRYADAGVAPPELLYVDRDCCNTNSRLRRKFEALQDMTIRSDIWHRMRRLATGCSTDSHQLYSVFLGRLSACIFEWSGEDLRLLMEAKRAVLDGQHILNPTDQYVISSISQKEMARHCKRKTRGAEETTRLIGDLIEALDREQGLDTIGVPLFDHDRIWHEWDKQNHMECIHDPDDINLCTKICEMVKGGVTLPVFRCARGSTS
eukprot:XP_011665519.1 PREDICTED: uncharacterized protein LOC105438869 [Strongylocentrotus purpuratus]